MSDDEPFDESATDERAAGDATAHGLDALSPSVRRLVKQYGLDVAKLRGTGPDGRIRVGDVMALIGGREAGAEPTDAGPAPERREDGPTISLREPRPAREAHEGRAAASAPQPRRRIEAGRERPPAAAEAVTTTVFECDAGAVLESRRRHRERGREMPLTAYFVSSFAKALAETHAFGGDRERGRPALAIESPRAAGGAHLITGAAALTLEQISLALSAPAAAAENSVVVIRHHGLGGSVLAQSDRLAAGQLGVLGIGRIRREVVVRSADGREAPGIASQCLLSLTFRADRLGLDAANALMTRCVERIERWPVGGG